MINSIDLKETTVTHRTGALKLKTYNVTGVYCHWHDEYEFLIADENDFECIVDTVRYTVTKGQALLAHPHELHSVTNSGGELYAVVFDPSVVCGEELQGLLSPSVTFKRIYDEREEADKEVIRALKKLCEVAKAPKYGYELMLKAEITYVMGMIFENGDYKTAPDCLRKGNVFANVLKYVSESYADTDITLDKVAKAVSFSRSYVTRLFRENTGSSFCEYLTAYRLEKACMLLKNSSESVLDIALACGFSSVSYFIKVFKNAYGVTPLKYRAK